MENKNRSPYTPPALELQPSFTIITGTTVPIGTSGLSDFGLETFEVDEVLE